MPLSPDQVVALARSAEAADGVAPLDEATLLTLQHHPDRMRTWGDHRGFGLLIGDELSLLVAPQERGTGLGRRLLRGQDLPEGGLHAWSHGDHPAAAALAAHEGWTRARELWVMRTTVGDLAMPAAPAGMTLRGFRPDLPRDAEELLRVNAAAFAHHPEQGGMDAENLADRMGEPWFDPEGLIMAWAGEHLLGFHWTKRHGHAEGEVYVVGIDPTAQGRGLGRLLTTAGLAYLHSLGNDSVHLYVEADNAAAVGLYQGLGFTHDAHDTHVQYRR